MQLPSVLCRMAGALSQELTGLQSHSVRVECARGGLRVTCLKKNDQKSTESAKT
jgi:hypothetical protein